MSLEILNNPLIGNSLNEILGEDHPSPSPPSFPVLKMPTEFRQKTAKQIANTYYDGKSVAEGNGFKIYSDEPIFGGDIEEVRVYNNRFAKTMGGIDVVLFASKNGAFLLQRYMEALADSNQLILFLEINDAYNYNTVLRSVAGSNLTNKKDIPFAEILNFSRKHEVIITPDALKKLIQKGIYKNKVSLISWFLGLKDAAVGRIFNFFTKEIFVSAENFFNGISTGISGLKVVEKSWNPSPKEGEYDPVFIPEILYKELKKFYEHEYSKNPYENLAGQKNINSKIVKTLFEKIDVAKTFFQNLLNAAESFFPDFIFKKMNRMLHLFFKQIDTLEKLLVDPLNGMQHIVYRNFQIANAFLCGIYNSIIDILAGLFSIIGFIFKAVSTLKNISDNKVEYGEMFLELMEDLMEGIMKFDYANFLYQSITFQMKTMIRLMNWIEKAAVEFTVEKAAYYYGYIIGVIVDIIVETLLTGGAAAVAKLAKTVEAVMLNPLEKIAQAIEKTVTFTKDLLTRVLEFIQMLVREFKKGVKNLFAQLEGFIDEIFGFGEKVGDHVLTPAEKRVKEKQRKIQEKLERKKKGRKGKYNLEEVDILGSKPATKEELLEWEKKIKILAFKEKGRFKMATNKTVAFRYMEKHKIAAYFDAHEIPPIIWYREGSSNYVITHEYYHLEEFCKIGKKDFIKGDLGTLKEWHINNILREKYVAERLLENAEVLNLSSNELQHVKLYYQKKIIQPAINNGVEMLPEFIIKFKNYGL